MYSYTFEHSYKKYTHQMEFHQVLDRCNAKFKLHCLMIVDGQGNDIFAEKQNSQRPNERKYVYIIKRDGEKARTNEKKMIEELIEFAA